MDVTLEELRRLRSTLTTHRLQHETLVAQTQLLRQSCAELRHQLAAGGISAMAPPPTTTTAELRRAK